MSTSKKPLMPKAFLASHHDDGSGRPSFLAGPKAKLKLMRMKAAKLSPLFKIKKGKSFHGTSPTR